MKNNILINNRIYPKKFKNTAIVICLDGSQKEYLDEASKANLTPNLDTLINNGQSLLAQSAIPSFTNPNNVSIITGQPSSVHGICGNFFYTPQTKQEVMKMASLVSSNAERLEPPRTAWVWGRQFFSFCSIVISASSRHMLKKRSSAIALIKKPRLP